jgi:hypothetical protein
VGRTVYVATLAAAGCAVLSASSLPAAQSVDWGAIHSFAGHYHAIVEFKNGVRQEVSGESKIPFNRSFGRAGKMQYIFTGTSVASARSSGPAPTGPCAFQKDDPNHSGENPSLRIDLFINLDSHTYDWQPQPVIVHFESGGYSPECGGPPRMMTAMDLGAVPLSGLDLPTDSDVLCGKATLEVPDGDSVTKVDWYFYPDDGKPRQAPVCPAVLNPGRKAG